MKRSTEFSRRNFLKLSTMAAVPVALGGFPIFAHARPKSRFFNVENNKVLVLIQLQGGNDGLNTLFDANQYGNLTSVRENILVAEQSILNLTGPYGLHPSMQGLVDTWNNGALGIIQSVGYPNQNRSHFRSTDIWNSASDADEILSTGWIGRLFDPDHSDYPSGYPSDECPHPFALTMGKIVSETCQGNNINYSLALQDPFNPGTALAQPRDDVPLDCYGDALTFVNDTVAQTNAYAAAITAAANAGNNLSSKYDELTTPLSEKLKNVARLISGGLQTQIYIVQIGGFDTHDNQVVGDATQTGVHGDLLKELSDAICAFQDDLVRLNIDDRVIGMTYSEFGRRIRSNAGLGTDHGTAAPLFMFGSCVGSQILGESPEIDPEVGIDEGVPMQFDFRNIYGTVLSQWLGAEESMVREILFPEYQPLPLLKPGCSASSSVESSLESFELGLNISPNPTADVVTIRFTGNNDLVKIALSDSKGATLQEIASNVFSKSRHALRIDLTGLPPGSYFIHLESRGIGTARRIVKL